MDVLGPFPIAKQGNRYFLVAVDYFTQRPGVYTVQDQSAATTTADHRLVSEMFCHFGAP